MLTVSDVSVVSEFMRCLGFDVMLYDVLNVLTLWRIPLFPSELSDVVFCNKIYVMLPCPIVMIKVFFSLDMFKLDNLKTRRYF